MLEFCLVNSYQIEQRASYCVVLLCVVGLQFMFCGKMADFKIFSIL
jgi:hypothetical protein